MSELDAAVVVVVVLVVVVVALEGLGFGDIAGAETRARLVNKKRCGISRDHCPSHEEPTFLRKQKVSDVQRV
jgi:hypothetical protein